MYRWTDIQTDIKTGQSANTNKTQTKYIQHKSGLVTRMTLGNDVGPKTCISGLNKIGQAPAIHKQCVAHFPAIYFILLLKKKFFYFFYILFYFICYFGGVVRQCRSSMYGSINMLANYMSPYFFLFGGGVVG